MTAYRYRGDPAQTTVGRGYGKNHRQVRAFWKPIVDRGEGWCMEVVCINPAKDGGRWIRPGSKWHLAHDPTRSFYRGPAHAACNLSEAGTRGNRARKGRPKRRGVASFTTTRQW